MTRKLALDNGVDLGGPKSNAGRVQHAISTPQEGNIPDNGVYYNEIPMCPDVIKACKVGRVEFRARRAGRLAITPEEAWDVWEGAGGD